MRNEIRRSPSKVALLRVATAGAALQMYVHHLEACPAIGARGDCNCGLFELYDTYIKARLEAHLEPR